VAHCRPLEVAASLVVVALALLLMAAGTPSAVVSPTSQDTAPATPATPRTGLSAMSAPRSTTPQRRVGTATKMIRPLSHTLEA
jgi:hypothetical protein